MPPNEPAVSDRSRALPDRRSRAVLMCEEGADAVRRTDALKPLRRRIGGKARMLDCAAIAAASRTMFTPAPCYANNAWCVGTWRTTGWDARRDAIVRR